MIEMVGVVTRTLQPSLAPVRTSDAASILFIDESGDGPGVRVRECAKESDGFAGR
jgi:hypothetical protein